MSKSDGWDWRWLYYVGTVILRMPDKFFWKACPRTLNALSKVYVEHNSGSGSSPGSSKPNISPFGTPYGNIDDL